MRLRQLTICFAILAMGLIAIGPVSDVSAVDLYVNNVTGDDLNDGRTERTSGNRVGPFKSIGRAIREGRPGDRIILAKNDEPYRESITIESARKSGFPDKPFELIGNGAIIDGSQPVPVGAWEHVRGQVFRFRPRGKSHHMVFLDGVPAKRLYIDPDAKTRPELAELEWCLYAGYVYFCVESGEIPQTYDIAHSVLPVGLTLYRVRNVRVRDIVFQGFLLDGVNAHDGVSQSELIQLTCRGNGRSGISVGGTSKMIVQSCLVGSNGTSQVRIEGVSQTRLVDCDLIDDANAPEIEENGGKIERTKTTAELPDSRERR
jgi:hypothetical protein